MANNTAVLLLNSRHKPGYINKSNDRNIKGIAEPDEATTPSVAAPVSDERIERLELAVESLQHEIEDLKESFRTFKEHKAST